MLRRSVLSVGLLALSGCYTGLTQDDSTGATDAASTGTSPQTDGPPTSQSTGSTDMSAGTGTSGQASDPTAATSDPTTAAQTTAPLTTGFTTGDPGSTGPGDTGEPPPDPALLLCERWKSDRAQLGEGDWSGSVDACDPGTLSQDGRDNALRLVNLYRFIAGLPAVTEDPARSSQAQACALMMHANGQLSHTPPMSWKCWTAAGADAAGQSNISGTPGVLGVDLYMVDPGNDTTIGHRRWLLSNYLGPIGLGSTSVNSCLMVIGGNGNAGKPWLAWPPPGPVPYQALHVPTIGWSDVDKTGWTVQSDTIDLGAATVSVTVDGVDRPVATNALGQNYGSSYAIRFVPQGWTVEPGKTYAVELGNVAQPIAYAVQIVDCPKARMWTPPEKLKHAVPEARWPTAEEAAASLLCAPLEHAALRLARRSWVPAMVPWRATEDGEVTDDVVDWYARFAAGRPGALVVEATGVRDVPSGPLLRIGDDRFIPGLTRLAAAVRAASNGETRLFIQLIDFLAVKRRPPADKFFARFLAVDAGHRERLAALDHEPRWLAAPEPELRAALFTAGPARWPALLLPRELRDLEFGYRESVSDVHLPQIRALPQVLPGLFAAAAVRARAAGFDGVELHYAHAYTLASFLSRTNTRDDGYGSTLEGRLRLPLAVIAAVRERVGADFVLGCRMLGDEVIAGGSDLADAARFARAFARAGLDFISISKGGKFDDALQPKVGEAVYPYTGPSGYECMPTVTSDQRGPFARNLPLAAAIRAAIRGDGLQTPVVAAGGLNSFTQAEQALRSGQADIIAAARQSLADPDWWEKLRLGHGDQIRRCKYTNYCEALDTRHKQVTCQLWDRQGLDAPDVTLSHDGRRRLLAPRWR